MTKQTVRERFDSKWKLDPSTGCWVWQRHRNQWGYGVFVSSLMRGDKAHRHGWAIYRGPIPAGLVIDHLCRNRACVNPDHLRLVTPRTNSLENSVSAAAQNFARPTCSRGHAYTAENTYVWVKNGRNRKRDCRVCRRETYRRLVAARGTGNG